MPIMRPGRMLPPLDYEAANAAFHMPSPLERWLTLGICSTKFSADCLSSSPALTRRSLSPCGIRRIAIERSSGCCLPQFPRCQMIAGRNGQELRKTFNGYLSEQIHWRINETTPFTPRVLSIAVPVSRVVWRSRPHFCKDTRAPRG